MNREPRYIKIKRLIAFIVLLTFTVTGTFEGFVGVDLKKAFAGGTGKTSGKEGG
ncbi:MAG: hypothetical protein HY582_02160, partial [Candidatus Omnitrophica bacterium]|nr:hypothetical protein [Candidatus Omnitrophota bacterium]